MVHLVSQVSGASAAARVRPPGVAPGRPLPRRCDAAMPALLHASGQPILMLMSIGAISEEECCMTAGTASTSAIVTLADLLEQLGGIAPARVRIRPVPGAATEEDILAIHDREGRLCELVDGVLVEKAMGLRESYLAIVLSTILWNFVQLRNLGLVTGEAGMMRLMAGLVRIPDVAFISWARLPGQCVPT